MQNDQIESELQNYAKAIKVADSLIQLRDYLNAMEDRLAELNVTSPAPLNLADFGVDTADLPTFGGDEPHNTFELYSWDDQKYLRADGARWYLEHR